MGLEQAASRSKVLICAPHGRDAQLIGSILSKNGICAEPHPTLETLAGEVSDRTAAIIVTEEALAGGGGSLREALRNQPPWSDLPVIVLTTGNEASAENTWELMQRLEPISNVSLLERPLRTMTLVSAVRVALRSRSRQYELHALHDDLERRVAERTAELQRLNEEAEGFSYTIAHDLRTPLRAINSTSHVLLAEHRHELSDAAAEELLHQASAAARMADLIDDLLRLSRLSRDAMRPTEFDLSDLAGQVVDELFRVNEPAPKCEVSIDPGMKAYGDPLLVRFALLNLVQNACKSSPEGGAVRVGAAGDCYFVEDHGIGFDQAYACRIFKPFERLEPSKVPGTGIGLANVKRIIERHGGKVWAESSPGKGSCFYFTLPRVSAATR